MSSVKQKLKHAFAVDPPVLLVLLNLNQLVDRELIRLARHANPRARVVLLLHEPHTKEKLI